MLLLTPQEALKPIAEWVKSRRIAIGYTQQALASRSGVSLASVRKFEQTGQISLQAFLKLVFTLESLDAVMDGFEKALKPLGSMDELIALSKPSRKRGWRK